MSALLVVGWSGWAALAVRGSVEGAPVWLAAIVYVIGLVTCHIAFNVVSAFYPGSFYRYKNLPLAAAAFVLFALWPAGARFLFGWFFRLF